MNVQKFKAAIRRKTLPNIQDSSLSIQVATAIERLKVTKTAVGIDFDFPSPNKQVSDILQNAIGSQEVIGLLLDQTGFKRGGGLW